MIAGSPSELTARTLAVSGKDSKLAGVYKITITAETWWGKAIATGNTADFTLTLTGSSSSAASAIANVINVAVVGYATKYAARKFVRPPGSTTGIVKREGRISANSFDNGLRIDPSATAVPTGSGSNIGQDSFDGPVSKKEITFTTDKIQDPFLDAKTEVSNDNAIGLDSFDFALDNLSGYYGDLHLY